MEANFNILEALKQSNTRKKVFTFKRPIGTNKMLEYDYYSIINYMLKTIKETFKKLVLAKTKTEAYKSLVVDSELPALEGVIIEWKKEVESKFNERVLESVAEKYVNKVDRYQKLKFKTAVNYGFGIDITHIPEFREYKPFIKSEVKKNLSLLTDLRDETIHKLEMMLRTAIERGTNPKEIAEMLVNTTDIQERRAKLIARNEVKNVVTLLNKKRMQNVGFEKAQWLAGRDSRVRPDHRKFNNKVYTIGVGLKNSKGEYEEAGQSINCRCSAIPIINLEEDVK
jgi:SPP1 gp7 family putative phage head morphogenesis protein